jgi:anaerobic magnesium-protoporphyrin IX monomethyl ester cyclase
MKIIFIYPNHAGYGRIPIGLAILMTILQENGHEVDLFDTTFSQKENSDHRLREEAGVAVPTDLSNLYDKNYSQDEIDQLLLKKIVDFKPVLIGVTILEDNYVYANHLFQVIKREKNIPIIVGGSTPTIAPEVIIENPQVDYLIQGEAENTLLDFCNRMEKRESVDEVKNLWFKKEGKVYHNPIESFVNLDDLPVLNLDLWDKRHNVKPYDGKIYQAGFFELSRGCMNKCSYCINDSMHQLLADGGKYFRRKSIDKAICEIKTLKEKFKYEMIFFTDDAFLQMSSRLVKEFSDIWIKEINLPFWMNTTAESVTREKLILLKEMGCCGIGFGVETGSEWIRRYIHGRKTKNETFIKTFKLIHEVGIRTTANCMMGFPGEYEEDIFETIKFMKVLKPDSLDVCTVAPYIGTKVHKVCYELGYIDCYNEPGFEGIAKEKAFRGNIGIKHPAITNERLLQIYNNFMNYVNDDLLIPEKFQTAAPGSLLSIPRGNLGQDIAEIFQQTTIC